MRAVIWGDMEGVAGITKLDQINTAGRQYEEGRKLYTDEINAAVRGAKKSGFKEIVVIDSHSSGGELSFNNLIKEKLESGADYVFGHRWGCYIDPLKSGCDAFLLVGAHSMAGTGEGVLSQTMPTSNFYSVSINGKAAGEIAIAVAIAASFNVPTVFISGDDAAIREARELIGKSLVAAVVKQGFHRFGARSLAPIDACSLIEKNVHLALKTSKSWLKPLKLASPVELKVEFTGPESMKDFIGRTGLEVVAPKTVISRGKTFWEAWNQFWYQ
jgi:D-amino peptidase